MDFNHASVEVKYGYTLPKEPESRRIGMSNGRGGSVEKKRCRYQRSEDNFSRWAATITNIHVWIKGIFSDIPWRTSLRLRESTSVRTKKSSLPVTDTRVT
jgi:hypothetical protein